jgi:DNA-binding beta-propeller fold protein YncE
MTVRLGHLVGLVICLGTAAGCTRDRTQPELVWGRRGVQDGDLVRPRAAAIDSQDRLYIVDFTARIQVYDRDGNYLGSTWTTPDYRNGRPSGLSIDRDGNLIVSDSHYNCFRIYSPDGKELRKIGGEAGSGPGQLGYVSDVVQDADGYFYVAEFGENQRITKLDVDGRFVQSWGSMGTEPGQFARARALALGPDGNLYVADACNHRIQVFTRTGELVRCWGEPGHEPGQLSYPFDLAFNPKGELYVVEQGNHRVQKFTITGEPLGCWGGPGREPGCLNHPWALVVDSKGRVHVLDTDNHRVQRISDAHFARE